MSLLQQANGGFCLYHRVIILDRSCRSQVKNANLLIESQRIIVSYAEKNPVLEENGSTTLTLLGS